MNEILGKTSQVCHNCIDSLQNRIIVCCCDQKLCIRHNIMENYINKKCYKCGKLRKKTKNIFLEQTAISEVIIDIILDFSFNYQ